MPYLLLLVDLLVSLGSLLIRFFTLTRGLLLSIISLIKAYWPKIIAALPAIFYFFIDRIGEALYDMITDYFDSLTQHVQNAPNIPFPTIKTLAEQLGESDPAFVEWLTALRVVEGLSIIGTVATWRYGKDIVMRIIGKLAF